jgi:hypothetical protein
MYALLVLPVLVALFFTVFKFNVVPEGWMFNITTIKSFTKAIINWRGFKLDKDWNVVEGANLHFWPFGIRFIGIRGLSKIDSKISAQPIKLEIEVDNAETVKPERIPLTIPFLVLIQFVNPWKARFKSPSDLIEVVKKVLHAMLRRWIANRTYDFVLDSQQSPKTMWENGLPAYIDPNDPSNNRPEIPALREDPEVIGLEEKYGVRVVPEGIKILDVNFTETYQNSLSIKEKKRLDAEALAKQVETIVDSRMANALTNGDVGKLRAMLLVDDVLRKKYELEYKSLTSRLLAQEDGSYTETHAHGGGLADLIAFGQSLIKSWGQVMSGVQNGPDKGNRKKKGNRPPQGPQGP